MVLVVQFFYLSELTLSMTRDLSCLWNTVIQNLFLTISSYLNFGKLSHNVSDFCQFLNDILSAQFCFIEITFH